MAPFTILRFLYLHRLVASQTLPVVRAKEPGFVRIGFVERLAMTTLAKRRLNTHWSMVMASLTHRVLAAVEVRRYSAVVDVLHQPIDDLPVREFHRFVLLSKKAYRYRIRDIRIAEREPRLSSRRPELIERAVSGFDRNNAIGTRTGVANGA